MPLILYSSGKTKGLVLLSSQDLLQALSLLSLYLTAFCYIGNQAANSSACRRVTLLFT